jgi:preprotein translocase subunit SecE
LEDARQGEKRFMADKIKLSFAVAFLIAGLVAYYYFSTMHGLARAGMVVMGLALATVMTALSAPGQQLLVFIREANEERRKVVWPTGKEAFRTAVAVFIFVTVMALFLWLADKVLEFGLYELILGWKK